MGTAPIDLERDILLGLAAEWEEAVSRLPRRLRALLRRPQFALKPRFAFAITGTPLENHVGEYFSILDLALPGLVGDAGDPAAPLRKTAASRLEDPALERLVERTRPFVLRRTKDEILAELPPGVETDLYLDLSEAHLTRHGITFTRLGGSTPVAKRRRIVGTFQDEGGPTAFLVSLKAGGQRRAVTITRMLMRHTVEEKMMKLKRRKLALNRAVRAGDAAGRRGAAISREDFAFLLG
jgi:SNF2 family DNA or RNA helicase